MSASLSVGSTFAVLNPPMSAKALVVSREDVPRPWHPSANQVSPTFGKAGADLMADLTSESVPANLQEHNWRAAPICGIVTVNNELWMPASPRKCPPSITAGLGMYLSAQFCMLYNGSSEARRWHRWAVVTLRGEVLILTSVSLKDRPLNPCDFPPIVTGGLTYHQAEQAMVDLNTPRYDMARVPREWTIGLRRADTVEMEGGAA